MEITVCCTQCWTVWSGQKGSSGGGTCPAGSSPVRLPAFTEFNSGSRTWLPVARITNCTSSITMQRAFFTIYFVHVINALNVPSIRANVPNCASCLACSRFLDSGESVNWENEHEKRVGAGERHPPPFLQIPGVLFSCFLSNFRAVLTIWEPGTGYSCRASVHLSADGKMIRNALLWIDSILSDRAVLKWVS